MRTSRIRYGDLINLAKGRYYYLASPYTHEDQGLVEHRVEMAHEYYCEFLIHGVSTYNATYESHRAARNHKLPTHYKFWTAHNSMFIRPSAGVIVACEEGWEESRGVQHEVGEAWELGLPAFLSKLSYVTKEMQLWRLDPQ